MSDRPWFVEAFGADYVDVYAHRDASAARREVEFLVSKGVRGRTLDLCCGFGRHTAALRERGIDAFGLDLSPELLERATTGASGDLLRGRLVRADARAVPFRDGAFDSLVNLFSSFGYFGDGGDRAVLAEIARVLVPGGLACLDLMNPARVRSTLVPESRSERAGASFHERRSLVDGGRRVRKDVRLDRPGRGTREWSEEVRLYEIAELQPWLADVGLVLTGVHGDFAEVTLAADAPRQILFVRRTSR